jgi:cytochrome c biogenesis protein
MADAEAPASLIPDVPTVAHARAAKGDVFDRLWRLLSSVRFAMLLIAITCVGVLVGTLIMQAPADIARDPDSFAGWLMRPQGKYGQPWASIFGALDLYRVFSSVWFRGTLAVAVLAVIVCTVNRMPGILASIRRPTIRVPERLFEKAPLRAEFRYTGVTAEQVQIQAQKVLGAKRFRVIPWQDGEAKAVFADRNRWGKAGTFLNHIGIVLILGAAVLGNVTGWREEGFMVPEGSTRAVGHGTGFVVRNEGFVDEYFPSGTPRDYRSDLVVERDGQEIARKTIRVNDPLDVAGVRFHQAFFGPAAAMRVSDATGKVIFDDGVALGYQFDGDGIVRNGGFFTLNNRSLAVYVLVPAAQRGVDPTIPAGNVRLEIFEPRQPRPSAIETIPQGTPTQIMGYTFEFMRERQFSGLQVVHNPAVNGIWIASALMLIGMIVVFNFPLRRVWARAEAVDAGSEDADGASGASRGDRSVRLRLAAVSNRDVLFAREFEALALAIDRQIGALPRSMPPPPSSLPPRPHAEAPIAAAVGAATRTVAG